MADCKLVADAADLAEERNDVLLFKIFSQPGEIDMAQVVEVQRLCSLGNRFLYCLLGGEPELR